MSISSSWLGSSDVLNDSLTVKNGWASELDGRMVLFPRSVENFIDELLPCSTPFPNDDDLETLRNAFNNYRPLSGREVMGYPSLLAGLRSLAATFPEEKKLDIVCTPFDVMDFPFDAFKRHHQTTKPDISVSFPGQQVTRREWQTISMVMEAKGGEEEDPFPKNANTKHIRTVEQLAKNAQNLMLAHGFLSAFVVGIYGRTIRLARFDHAYGVVSPPFSFDDDGGAWLVKKFLWHFVHPIVGHRVVGSDPTLTPFSPDDREWVMSLLSQLKPRKWEAHVGELEKGRRVEVYDQRTGKCVPYLCYHLVDVNGRLFSRATMVWRAIEDTRIWKDRQLVPDPNCSRQVKPRILKEAWRQLVRTAETEFYDRLESRIPHEEMFGLARMECGGDIGALEAKWWKRTVSGELPELVPSGDAAADDGGPLGASSGRSAERARPFCSIGSANVPDDRFTAPTPNHVPPFPCPLRYPQHETYSSRLNLPKSLHRERSHMRMVIEDVGHPLTEFNGSREAIAAMRDAIKGHETAWREAKVLHRDVSLGNILIADDPSETSHRGFLHDFDYSSMEPIDSDMRSSMSSVVADGEEIPEEDVAKFKERTGTYYFMAMEFLDPDPETLHQEYHDLESYYWVLIWVVLRHTDCHRPRRMVKGQVLCERVFRSLNDAAAHSNKLSWVSNRQDQLVVMDNNPLTILVRKFTNLVRRTVSTDDDPGTEQPRLTHKEVLELFDEALAMEGWPENDWKPCTMLDDPDPRTGLVPVLPDIPSGYEIETEGRALRSRTASRHSQVTALAGPSRLPSLGTASGSRAQPRSGTKRTHEGDAPAPSGATHSRKRSKATNMGPPLDPGDAAVAGPSGATMSGGRNRRSGSQAVLSRQPTRSSSRIRAQKERGASSSDSAR